MSLRTRVAFASVAGLAVVIVAGMAARPWLQAGVLYPWKAAAVFALMMTIAITFVGKHRFPRLGPANRVTIIRSVLLALVAGLIGEPNTSRVAWTVVTAATAIAVLDSLDGRLARRSGMASDFGARFDMEIDGLFILVLSILVWRHGKAGAWVLLGGIMRYAFIAAGWWLPWMARPLLSTYRAKAVAVTHIVGLIVAMGPIIPMPLSAIGVAATLALLCWSFAVDVRRLWRKE